MESLPGALAVGLVTIFVLAASVWVGGLVTLLVVARATRTLSASDRVRTFRAIGRAYGPIGAGALAISLALGMVLTWNEPRDLLLTVTAVVAAGLVVVTAVGVVQARAMTRLRRDALDDPADAPLAARVRRGARRAGVSRASIGVLTLLLVVLGSALAT